MATETDRLRAVATYYAHEATYAPTKTSAALADLFDGIADRHHLRREVVGFIYESCSYDGADWPCRDVRAALAVADALGVE